MPTSRNLDGGTNYDWDRSISEPDLTDPFRKLNRFIIKHPHEYISVDDLKYFRRKKPPDHSARSNICFDTEDNTGLPFSLNKSEYRSSFGELNLVPRPLLLRRSTSLRLEGLMHLLSEQREQYHWFSPADWESSRAHPIKNPENLQLTGDFNMNPEYRSSFISYPMVDRTMKILPREMFRIDPESKQSNKAKENSKGSQQEVAAINKLLEDKFKRDVAAREQQKCHLQQRAAAAVNYNTLPSEYRRQFVQFPIEKAHSIPQISHFKMQGEFAGIPEYQDSYRMYANYSKSAPIKKNDHLIISGAEMPLSSETAEKAEYREKFCEPPSKEVHREKSLKTQDHLRPQGEFTKILPEYYESFSDPQVKVFPERGKCREPYLRLKGKIEFNPEYRNTYLDFPRSRPITKKPPSTFRLPTSTSTTTSPTTHSRSPKRIQKRQSPQRVSYEEYDPETTATVVTANESPDITTTPEYRRALTHYQLRERTPTRKKHFYETDGGGNSKYVPTSSVNRKSSDSSFDFSSSVKPPTAAQFHKKRPMRQRQSSILETQAAPPPRSNFEKVGQGAKKAPKFGRRASILQNAANCRENSSIVEGNPKYAMPRHHDTYEPENRESFVVLKEPCKRSNWMKKSWYES